MSEERTKDLSDSRSFEERIFARFDAVLSPVYSQVALKHGSSVIDSNFEGFSYTMTWSVAGFPAATVRCGEAGVGPAHIGIQRNGCGIVLLSFVPLTLELQLLGLRVVVNSIN